MSNGREWEIIEKYVDRVNDTIAFQVSDGVRTLLERVQNRTRRFRSAVKKRPEQEALLNTVLRQTLAKLDVNTMEPSKMVSDMCELNALYDHISTITKSL